MKTFSALAVLSLLSGFAFAQDYTQYVDPTIGTGDHGHVFMGANVPQGMVNAGPTQTKVGWDWCSGYHESCDSIVGFAQLHFPEFFCYLFCFCTTSRIFPLGTAEKTFR